MNKIGTILLFLILIGCEKKTTKKPLEIFKSSLVKQQIGTSNFYISIPKNYIIKENQGPDFSVFYINLKDTTETGNYTAGMYFGNHPQEFEAEEKCKKTDVKNIVLQKKITWEIYQCNKDYFIQSIFESGSNEGWNQTIHAFGNGKSQKDIEKIIAIYNTLEIKKVVLKEQLPIK